MNSQDLCYTLFKQMTSISSISTSIAPLKQSLRGCHHHLQPFEALLGELIAELAYRSHRKAIAMNLYGHVHSSDNIQGFSQMRVYKFKALCPTCHQFR